MPIDSMTLEPIVPLRTFQKWVVVFVGPISPPIKSAYNKYILVAMDHVTKWVEARAFNTDDAKNATAFLYENIIM